MRKFTRASLIGAISLTAGLGLAAPALAATSQPPPVPGSISATVTVVTSENLSLSESTMAFGSLAPGATNSPATAPLVITVTSTDPSGYTVSWVPPASGTFSNGSASFPVSGNLMSNAGNLGNTISSMMYSTTASAPGGDAETITPTLSVPGSQAPGAYTAGPFALTLQGA